jgi:hypothetical protein
MTSMGWIRRTWMWIRGIRIPEPQYLSAAWLMDHVYRDGTTGEWRR